MINRKLFLSLQAVATRLATVLLLKVCCLKSCPGDSVTNYPVWSAFGEVEEGSLHQLCVWPAGAI